jgi:hypothetical protein
MAYLYEACDHLDPSDSYFLFADLVGFYTHLTYPVYAHFSGQLLMAEI